MRSIEYGIPNLEALDNYYHIYSSRPGSGQSLIQPNGSETDVKFNFSVNFFTSYWTRLSPQVKVSLVPGLD